MERVIFSCGGVADKFARSRSIKYASRHKFVSGLATRKNSYVPSAVRVRRRRFGDCLVRQKNNCVLGFAFVSGLAARKNSYVPSAVRVRRRRFGCSYIMAVLFDWF